MVSVSSAKSVLAVYVSTENPDVGLSLHMTLLAIENVVSKLEIMQTCWLI